jgi:hypothetical protein
MQKACILINNILSSAGNAAKKKDQENQGNQAYRVLFVKNKLFARH